MGGENFHDRGSKDPLNLKEKLILCVERLRERGNSAHLIAFKIEGSECDEYWVGDNIEELDEDLDARFGEETPRPPIIIFEAFQEVDENKIVKKFGYRTSKIFGCEEEIEIVLPVRKDILKEAPAGN